MIKVCKTNFSYYVFIFCIIYFLLSHSSIFATDHHSHPINYYISTEMTLDTNKSDCKINIALSTGFYELSALRIGYQINEQWGIALKGNFVSPGFFNTTHGYGRGIGLKISRTFDQWFIFNNISFEPTYLTKAYVEDDPRNIDGAILEINTGKEVVNLKGLHFFWSIGYSWRFVSGEESWNKFCFKLGLNYRL